MRPSVSYLNWSNTSYAIGQDFVCLAAIRTDTRPPNQRQGVWNLFLGFERACGKLDLTMSDGRKWTGPTMSRRSSRSGIRRRPHYVGRRPLEYPCARVTRPLAKVRLAQLASLKNQWLGSQSELLLQEVYWFPRSPPFFASENGASWRALWRVRLLLRPWDGAILSWHRHSSGAVSACSALLFLPALAVIPRVSMNLHRRHLNFVSFCREYL